MDRNLTVRIALTFVLFDHPIAVSILSPHHYTLLQTAELTIASLVDAILILPLEHTTTYCLNKDPTSVITNLDLTEGSDHRPTIDGVISNTAAELYTWSGSEYDSFTLLRMYVQGDSNNKPWVANAYVAHDCLNKIMCLATHSLSNATQNYDKIVQNTDEAWIRFGPDKSARKLVIGADTNTTETSYIIKPEPDSDEAIGYEGCWDR